MIWSYKKKNTSFKWPAESMFNVERRKTFGKVGFEELLIVSKCSTQSFET
jgi:hypothetical protein